MGKCNTNLCMLVAITSYCRKILSAPFSRPDVSHGSGWYGGKVCTLKVYTLGDCQWKKKLRHALDDAELDNLTYL